MRFEDSDPALEPLPLDGDDGELEKKFSTLLKTLRERLLALIHLSKKCDGKTQSAKQFSAVKDRVRCFGVLFGCAVAPRNERRRRTAEKM